VLVCVSHHYLARTNREIRCNHSKTYYNYTLLPDNQHIVFRLYMIAMFTHGSDSAYENKYFMTTNLSNDIWNTWSMTYLRSYNADQFLKQICSVFCVCIKSSSFIQSGVNLTTVLTAAMHKSDVICTDCKISSNTTHQACTRWKRFSCRSHFEDCSHAGVDRWATVVYRACGAYLGLVTRDHVTVQRQSKPRYRLHNQFYILNNMFFWRVRMLLFSAAASCTAIRVGMRVIKLRYTHIWTIKVYRLYVTGLVT